MLRRSVYAIDASHEVDMTINKQGYAGTSDFRLDSAKTLQNRVVHMLSQVKSSQGLPQSIAIF